MKRKIILGIFMPFSLFCMENQKSETHNEDLYNKFKREAMQSLTEEEKEALRPDNYKKDREKGAIALHSFARHVIKFAFAPKSEDSKVLPEEELAKKSSKYAEHMIELRDISLGLRPVEITDEFTARTYAVSLLTEEEQKSLQRNEYRINKDKAHKTLTRYAQLTAEELAKRNLLPCQREEFEKKFIDEKIKELDEMWSV